MIDFNKLTLQAQNTVVASQSTMKRFQNSQLEPLHLLYKALEDNIKVYTDEIDSKFESAEQKINSGSKHLLNLIYGLKTGKNIEQEALLPNSRNF